MSKQIDRLIRVAVWGLGSGIAGQHFHSVAISVVLICFGLALIHGDED